MSNPNDQNLRNLRTLEIIQSGHVFSLCSLSAASYIDPRVDRHWEALKQRLDEDAI